MSEPPKPSRARPWSPRKATEEIRKLARQEFSFCWTKHANDQMLARDLIVGDVVHVLRHGFVYDEAEPSTRQGFFKYSVESRSPNSGNRTVRVVVVPQRKPPTVKIVTVMWADEPMQR